MNFGSHTAKNILHLGFFAVLLHDYFFSTKCLYRICGFNDPAPVSTPMIYCSQLLLYFNSINSY